MNEIEVQLEGTIIVFGSHLTTLSLVLTESLDSGKISSPYLWVFSFTMARNHPRSGLMCQQ